MKDEKIVQFVYYYTGSLAGQTILVGGGACASYFARVFRLTSDVSDGNHRSFILKRFSVDRG